MIVKICGITNVDDALAAAEAGTTAVGFNFFAGSPRYIPVETAARIAERLPASVWKVGVFVNAPGEVSARVAREAVLDIVQLHGDENPADTAAGLRYWKAFRVRPGWDVQEVELWKVEALLLDSPAPGSGQAFDWSLARGLKRPFLLAGGLDENNVAAAIRAVRPWGVDACSRLESAPGRKDHGKLMRFVQAARSERE